MSCHWQPTANQRAAQCWLRLMGFSNNSRSQPAMMTMTSVTMTSTMTLPTSSYSVTPWCNQYFTRVSSCVVFLPSAELTSYCTYIFWRLRRIYWHCICCCDFNSHLLTVIIALNAAVTLHILFSEFYMNLLRLYFFYFLIICSCDMHLSLMCDKQH